MASDREKRKHRRSSDDETEEPSKRRKHRHHRRHHHRRHRNRKHEDKREEEEEGEEELKEVGVAPPRSGAVSAANCLPNFDMEEGEIVEEDGAVVVVVEEGKKRADSEAESGEIQTETHEPLLVLGNSCRLQSDDDNVQIVRGTKEDHENDDLMTNAPVEIDLVDGTKTSEGLDLQMSLSTKHNGNGDMRSEFSKGGINQHTKNWSPEPEEDGKRKTYYDHDRQMRNQKEKSLSSENPRKVHKYLASLPVHERNRENVTSASRSRTRDRGKERSPSPSISHGASRLETCQEDTDYYICGKHKGEGDDERTSKLTEDRRHGSRDSSRGTERERSSSRGRHNLHVDKHHSQDTWERSREGSHETWDGDRGRDLEKTERDRMRRKEQEVERERESSRDREWYRERERGREKDRERERERDRDRDRRERERREREGERERRERERERERRRDRDKEFDRNSRSHKYNDVSDRRGGRDRSIDYKHHTLDDADYRDRQSKNDLQKVDGLKNGQSDVNNENLKREETDQEAYLEKSVLQVEEEEEEDLNKIREESRRRRQAILEKYKTQQLQQQQEPLLQDTVKKNVEEPSQPVVSAKVVSGTLDGHREGSNTDTGDMLFFVGKSPARNGISAVKRNPGTGGLGDGTPKSERLNGDDKFGKSPPQVRKSNERSNDMFTDDIFVESPAGVRKMGKDDGLMISRSGLQDNWDDAEGYYCYRLGEILDGRYEVNAALGKGVFSIVVRAKDLKARSGDPEEVAIKIIRNNEKMYKAGLDELVILRKLVGADLEDRRHCVRFLSSFKYRNHLCLVFESLHMNLREVLKKYGIGPKLTNIGLKLTAVRDYAKQLFIALKHLRNCGILHTDIKPDNMLVNANNVLKLKLCDFGNAMFAGKNEITPYLVSRFYRAPEIILGLPYDHAVDIWSVGCCLFELYNGEVLFPGPSNNDMLRLHMELKGPFPKKMLRKGAFTERHFDTDLNFRTTGEGHVTKKALKRLVNIKLKDNGCINSDDPKMVANFKDLLDKIFILDPDKRLTVQQALSHPFITGK